MNCPKCDAPNLRSTVSVVINRPAGNTGVTKKAIASKGIVILGVDWPNEILFCYQCGWTNKDTWTGKSEVSDDNRL